MNNVNSFYFEIFVEVLQRAIILKFDLVFVNI